MFYAIIDSASLKNPTILNRYHKREVTVSYEPESTANKYHYNFFLEIKTKDIEKVIAKIQKEMFPGWYSFFWRKNLLYIVFNSKFFKLNLPSGWSSAEYKEAKKFGRSQEIPETYLDFKKYFQPYLKMGKK